MQIEKIQRLDHAYLSRLILTFTKYLDESNRIKSKKNINENENDLPTINPSPHPQKHPFTLFVICNNFSLLSPFPLLPSPSPYSS